MFVTYRDQILIVIVEGFVKNLYESKPLGHHVTQSRHKITINVGSKHLPEMSEEKVHNKATINMKRNKTLS